jgi:hypothetical protein
MPVELQANMNAKNRKQHTKASVNEEDGQLNSVTTTHGYYAYFHHIRSHVAGFGCNKCERKAANGVVARDQGLGICGFDCKVCTCDCCCVFQEHNWQKICVGIWREKKRIEEQGISKRGSNPLPEETGATVWTQFIMTEMENKIVHELQHIDGCTSHELLHDIISLASNNVDRDLLMALDANVTRGLQKKVLLSSLRYCCADGSTRPMTLAQAMAVEKLWGGGELANL